MTIINSSTYRFMPLSADTLTTLQVDLKALSIQLGLKGTILLSPEGINIALAGTLSAMAQFKDHLNANTAFSDLTYNDSYSSFQPFQKLYVKRKKQIIPYDTDLAQLKKSSAPYVTPKTLWQWLNNKQDMVLLDTRNQYEVKAGSFQNALSTNLKHFRDFPKHAAALPATLKEKTVVTFCTGGIRCEKAAATLIEQGFQKVYQLQGGILNYFKAYQDQYYKGQCFVFDERETLDPKQLKAG